MDIVVYLALAVLAAVFLFSLFILVVMCHRKYEYNRLLLAQSLRFSKLRQDNLEDIIQLGPHISQKLSTNTWVEEVSGILEDCVAVLKLCHILTDQMAKVPLTQIDPQLNEVICQATTRVVPRFDALLRSMASKNVDIRVIEARVASLVTACWSLLTPFYLINSKHKDLFGGIVEEMELHHAHLLAALEQAERLDYLPHSQDDPSSSSAPQVVETSLTESKPSTMLKQPLLNNGGILPVRIANTSKLEESTELLSKNCLRNPSEIAQEDQAPADPASTR